MAGRDVNGVRWLGTCAMAGLLVVVSLGLFTPVVVAAAPDREEELEGLRERIQESRERVTAHEADERALLEQLEDVDRRLLSAGRDRAAARAGVRAARERLAEIEPEMSRAQASLVATRRALATRAVALYRGGELGPIRVLFSAASLQDLLSRASALRVLVRHDAELVGRFVAERDRLAALEEQARQAVAARETASVELARTVARLETERASKGAILSSVREDRTSERRLLLELEQAAQALEETIRQLGARASAGIAGSGFGERRGALVPPVSAPIAERFGKVIDPEFQTATLRNGLEFAAPAGTPVRSVAQGIVRFAGWFRGYGRIVILDHGDGFHTISGHLDEIHVTVDTPLDEGEVVGTVGETGSLGGPSLYFELREGGQPLDPEPWLTGVRG
jgi:septal ring factor EnvC (AmiA/AmiB activator)